MILVTVNPKSNRTTMISIPRDTLSHVQSSSYTGATKINAQYTYLNFQVKCNDDNEFLIVV
ncbi:LCP family glycopolymer transferase [Lacticaseibacillus suibinensis]|uniref:LCP family glycopolymer transferase n=1 Tax=Lacticaseibacillus suibinensis TaxID=2486011 RepID=UPI001CDD239A|nr:LCP family protein [Lacticaseibacillus suibinensis]